MDRRIDLTENRDFQKPFSIPGISRFLDRFPWNDILHLVPIEYFEHSFTGVISGGKRERDDLRYEIEVESSCQRCGTPVFRFPWLTNLYTDLCPSCNRFLREKKFPWKWEIRETRWVDEEDTILWMNQ